MIDNASQVEHGSGQPYALGKAIEAVKGAIPIEDYAAEFTQLQQNGQGLRGSCPVHGGDNPHSFAVYANEGRFYCFACQAHGDIIDLAELVERHADTWTAVVGLAVRFGVELPQRPERWHRHQNTKAQMREEMRKGLAKIYQRRLYRMLHDAGAHPEDDAALWEAMYPVAYLAATERVFG
ncbi:MAG TPA: CHC2 zinc finger domain-containing protein [Rubrobacteraceae bacterium]|nr:CHC2 zinc finger domain-containing protein [Rubrobacteraceae bacterium]